MESDKLLHLMTFLGASAGVTLLLASSLGFFTSFFLVLGIGILAGLGKEYVIDKTPNVKDMAANMLGMGMGLGIAVIAYAIGVV